MKILQIFIGFGIGGDATVFFDLCRALQAEGHETTLVAQLQVITKRLGPGFVERAEERGLTYHTFHKIPLFESESGLKVKDYDLVHVHFCGTYLPFQFAKQLRKAFQKKPIVCTLHGPESTTPETTPARVRLSIRLSARLIDAFVVPSKHKKSEWAFLSSFHQKIVQIPNPVKLIERKDAAQAREALGWPAVPIILFLGRFSVQKRPLDLIEAVALLQKRGVQTHLVLAGRGKMEEECRGRISELGLDATVMPFQVDIATPLSAADVLAFPSEFENYPLSLFEAASVGLPIAASDIPVVQDELGGMNAVQTFPVGDVERFADALEGLLKPITEQDRDTMRAYVRQNCSFEAVAKQHVALYEKLLG